MSGPDAVTHSRFARARARRSIVQAYYQWQITRQSINEIIAEFVRERSELKKADQSYFRHLLIGMAAEAGRLDEIIAPYLDRKVSELDPVERAILHLGAYELMTCREIPWRVVINESVDLAKLFGAEQSYKYINGILDNLARDIRPVEDPAGS